MCLGGSDLRTLPRRRFASSNPEDLVTAPPLPGCGSARPMANRAADSVSPAAPQRLRNRRPLLAAVPEVVSGIGVADIFIATICSLVICEQAQTQELALALRTRKIVAPFRSAITADVKPVILLFNNTANGTSVHWL